MPQVPRLSVNQVQDANVPAARITSEVNPDLFGNGQAFSQLTNAAKSVAFDEIRKAKNDANDMAVNEATAQATRELTDKLYNPDGGLYSQKGKNAAASFQSSQADYQKRLSEIESAFSNDDQRKAFREKSAQLYQSFYEAGSRHISGEIAQYDQETSKARLEANRNLVSADPFNRSAVQQALDDNKEVVMKMGQRQGWSPETLQENLLETESKVHSVAVESMLNSGKYTEAGNYFNGIKDTMTFQDRDRLEKGVREGSLRSQSTQIADNLFSKGVSLSAGFAEIRKIDDPDLRAKATEAFRLVKHQDDMVRQEKDRDINVKAANILDANGGDISKIPPQMMTELSTAARSEIQRYGQTKARGLEPKTDWTAYNKAILMASSPDLQDKFMTTDLIVEYRNKMSDSEMKELIHLQAGLIKSDEKVKGQLDDYREKSQIVKNVIGELKLKDNSPEANAFETAVGAQQRAMQNQLGRKLTNDEMESIVKKQAMKVPREGFFTIEKRLFEYKADELVNDIPQAQLNQIRESLKKRNRPETPANISALYSEYLRNSNGK